MPKATIPRYGDRQVERAPLPAPRIPTNIPAGAAGAFGATPGQALAQATDVGLEHVDRALQHEHLKEFARANEMAVTDANAKLAELETQILHDPEKGVLNIHGKEALRGREVMDGAWAKGVSEIEKELTNDDQRAAFHNSVKSREVGMHSTIVQHASRELEKYDADETENFLGKERDAAIAAAAVKGVPLMEVLDRSSASIARQRDAVMAYASRRGVSPEKRDKMLADLASETHAGVIQQLSANKDDLTAKSYYEEYKDQLRGKDAIQMAKLVSEGSLLGEAQRASDSILTKYRDNRAGAMEEVRKIKDPELREKTEEQVIHRFNLDDAIERDQREKSYLTAANIIEPFVKQGRPFLASEVVPRPLWNSLSLEARNALEKRAGDRENDYRTWHSFLELTPSEMGSLNQEEFETRYWSKFDNVTRRQAEAMWQATRDAKRTGKLDPKTSADITFKDQVNETLKKMKMIPRGKTPEKFNDTQYQFWADFMLDATREKERLEAEKKRPLNSTEIQDVIDKLTMKRVFIDDHWGQRRDTQRLPSTIHQDERKQAYVPYDDIPNDQRAKADSAIRAAGKSSTKAKIERLYAAAVLGDRKLWDEILKEK